MTEYDNPHTEEDEAPPRDQSVVAQRAMCNKLNGWLTANEEGKAKRFVWNVKLFQHPAIVVEFYSPTSKECFVLLCTEDPSAISCPSIYETNSCSQQGYQCYRNKPIGG
jgi:hypothetical protein